MTQRFNPQKVINRPSVCKTIQTWHVTQSKDLYSPSFYFAFKNVVLKKNFNDFNIIFRLHSTINNQFHQPIAFNFALLEFLGYILFFFFPLYLESFKLWKLGNSWYYQLLLCFLKAHSEDLWDNSHSSTLPAIFSKTLFHCHHSFCKAQFMGSLSDALYFSLSTKIF